MKKLLIITIILSKVFTQNQNTVPGIEMIIQVTNSTSGVSRTFTATSVNGIIWDSVVPNEYFIVDNPSDYNNQYVEITGNHSGDNIGFDNTGESADQYPQLRYSNYRLSVSGSNATVLIEWQGCFLANAGTGDVTVIYDAQDNSFSLENPPSPIGEDCLQPTDPSNLELTSQNGDYVSIGWTSSNSPNVAKYNVYRKINNGNWYIASSGLSEDSWVDLDVIQGRPFEGTYFYKVKAVSADLTKESNNSTNIVSVQGRGINNKQLSNLYGNLLTYCYPNPFNSITTIQFKLIEQSHVKLTIFDILGNEVEVLSDKFFTKGMNYVKWDSKKVSSGIYFYQLKTSDIIITNKMYVLK